MKKFKVKFFGSKEKKEQIKQTKMELEANNEASVEEVLRRNGWRVINGLKIKEVKDDGAV